MTRAPAYGLTLIVLSNALPLLGVLLGRVGRSCPADLLLA